MTPQLLLLSCLLVALTLLLWARKRKPAALLASPPPVPTPLAGGQAKPALLTQLAADPKKFTVREWRLAVAAYARRGDNEKALTISQNFERTWPLGFTSRDRQVQASLLTRLNRLPEAIALYTTLLDQGIPHAHLYNNRGYLYTLLEEYTLAIPDFDKAIAFDPGMAFAYNNRGLSRLRRGLAAEGLADIEHSLQLDPQNAYAYRNLGIYYFEQGDYATALSHFEHAHQLGTEPPELAHYLRKTRQHLGLPPATDESLPLFFSDN